MAAVSPLPRTIRVEEKTVVIEGRWYPIEESAAAVPNTVTVTCLRSERRCREALVTAHYGRGLVTETLDYRVREWTKAKLVAVRMAGSDETQIRIYLTGFAAEKAVTGGAPSRREQRWRLE